jgi:polyisoprenoid-binding protein YceI
MILKSLAALLVLGASSLAIPQDAEGEEALKSGTYAIDGGHSNVLFRVTHLGVAPFWGRFNQVEGQVTLDAEDLSKSKVSIVIPVDSVDSNSADRDGHLKSPDFFSAKEFPELTFESTKVSQARDGVLRVTGDLTMLGESNEVSFDAHQIGHGERGRFGYRAGYEADFTVTRSDFGMDFMVGMLGDEVRLIVALETILQ